MASLAQWRAAGFRRIFFVDNVFNLPEGYARALCDRITAARLDIEWRGIIYPGRVSEALVRAMARAYSAFASAASGDGGSLALRPETLDLESWARLSNRLSRSDTDERIS